jgi:hypothetical protein
VPPAELFAGLPDGLGGGDAGLVLKLSHRPGVMPREGRDAVSGLLGDVGQAAALPQEQRGERAAQAGTTIPNGTGPVDACALSTAMTAKEKLLQRAPHWSEEQAERALLAAESDEAVDAWGDLSELHAVSSAETMRRLADEDQAAGHERW